MSYQSEFLSKELFDSAIKKIEEDAEWELRNPHIYPFHHQDIEKLKKIGFFKERK